MTDSGDARRWNDDYDDDLCDGDHCDAGGGNNEMVFELDCTVLNAAAADSYSYKMLLNYGIRIEVTKQLPQSQRQVREGRLRERMVGSLIVSEKKQRTSIKS